MDINQRINGSWLDQDAYRHWCYERMYEALDRNRIESGELKAIEFGSLQPTTPPIRMLKKIYRDRLDESVGRPFPDDDLMEPLPYSQEYDFVIADQVLEHVSSPIRAIYNMNAILRPGGYMIVAMPFLYPVHNCPVDVSRLTPYGLKELFQKFEDLELIECDSWGGKEVYRWWLDHLMDWVSIDRAMSECPGFATPEYGGEFAMIVWAIARKNENPTHAR